MGFNKLTPNFSVRNVKESVIFYQDMLGFKLEIAVPDGTNSIENEIHDAKEYSTAMMKKDDVFVMFLKHDNFEENTQAFKGSTEGATVLFYVDVSDIDELYIGLKGKVEIEKEIETTWYGMREFYIKDCNGYLLGFGERE
ncbi:MAG: VOC family protein [Candidatus Thiodiazotropha sp. (ex Dulcina madagascariensis)]|nr:VOC family protein [Candidatus Thiodiazotropha sp. (ex Dulcina madagascariensis)]